jgi:hypothetical protein
MPKSENAALLSELSPQGSNGRRCSSIENHACNRAGTLNLALGGVLHPCVSVS